MARTYKRDNRGRFASGGSTGSSSSKGKGLKRGRAQLAEARGKVRTAKGKLAAMDPADQTIKSGLSRRAQRGAVTKAEKRLTAVKRTAVIKGRRMTGTISKPKGLKPGTLKERAAKRNDEPVTVRKPSTAKGYSLPGKPPSAATTKPSPPPRPKSKPAAKTQTDTRTRMEKSIAGIMDRRVSRSASPEKQFKALQTQQRAARYLRAASRFAEKNNISLARALRSGPKNSTKSKKKRR